MYVRLKTSPLSPNTAVQVCTTSRDGDRVRQKIVRHFGTAGTDEALAALVSLAELYVYQEKERAAPSILKPEQLTTNLQQARHRRKRPDDNVRLNQMVGDTVSTIGFHDVYGTLYDELGFHRVLPPARQKASARNLKHVVLARIAQPKSKRGTAAMLASRFGVEIPLPAIYAMMDQLTPERIETIKRLATEAATGILPDPVDVLFFDCTTLYFESFKPDTLRQQGYSKDAKFKETQVVLALVVSQQGLPLTYELAAGSTFEGHTLETTLKKLKTRFEVRQATVVADRGMLSQDNLKKLNKKKFGYIVGAPLKRLKKVDQERVLAWRPDAAATQDFTIDGKRLVVSYSPKRAAHDAKQRRDMIAKLKKKLVRQVKAKQKKRKPAKELTISNSGYRRFIDIEGDYQVVINEAKVAEAARWDGLHGVYTSHVATTLDSESALEMYRGLWQVEAAFRVSKHDLQVRPIFHWKPQRIEAHVAIAFMCLTLVRMLSYRTHVQQHVAMSEERIRIALEKTQVATMHHHKNSKQRYGMPMALTADAKRLYKLMNIPYHKEIFVID